MFNTEEEEQRFMRWVQKLHDFRLTEVPVYDWKTVNERNRYGRWVKRRRKVFSHYVVKGVGEGIDDLTKDEMERVYNTPCRYLEPGRRTNA